MAKASAKKQEQKKDVVETTTKATKIEKNEVNFEKVEEPEEKYNLEENFFFAENNRVICRDGKRDFRILVRLPWKFFYMLC